MVPSSHTKAKNAARSRRNRRARPFALALLSGGLDSSACLHYFRARRYRVEALFVDYGQPGSNYERHAAQNIARHYGTRLTVMRVAPMHVSQGVIPGRNALLAVVALMSFPQPHGIVALGIHGGTSYSDCTSLFVSHVQAIYDLYASGSIRLDAPFIEWTKRDIYDYSKRHRLPICLTRSCESGNRLPCGRCNSCRDIQALHAG